MKYIKLKDVCKINMGQSPDSSSYNESGEGIPFFQGNADFGDRYPVTRIWCSEPKKVAQENDILISVRAPIGAINYSKEKCCIGRGLAALTVDKTKISEKLLFWVLKAKKEELNRQGTGSTFKAISKKSLEELLIPQIDIKEQEKDVEILEKIYMIIQNKHKELKLLTDLISARFVELFGDLKSNNKRWPIVGFKECADIDTNMIHNFEGYEDYPHIGINCIEKETGRLIGYRTIVEDGVISGKYLFTPKHIIYSKIRPNLNKVALPDFKGLCSADAYPILVKSEICNREYFGYTLRSKYFLDYILAFSNRTNLPKVNKNQVEGFMLPLPPIDLQNQFAAFVQQVNKSKFEVQKSLEKTQLLFDSLMQEYFG